MNHAITLVEPLARCYVMESAMSQGTCLAFCINTQPQQWPWPKWSTRSSMTLGPGTSRGLLLLFQQDPALASNECVRREPHRSRLMETRPSPLPLVVSLAVSLAVMLVLQEHVFISAVRRKCHGRDA